ncbi:lysozyme inhibitor LprI family protein [Pseudomonas sp. Pseusp122]|uniref:lysozyme inhibitor LprI family protein n=1 Tax=unclassified Pseudomonas TaxID=196821 RepID=UPI0039A65F4B
MRHSILAAALLVACSSSAVLAETKSSPEYDACIDKAMGDAAMSECTRAETRKQDARLNKAYKAAMAVLPEEKKKQLKEAQMLWVKFRDADCGMQYSFTGGTMDMLNGSSCELNMTQERADTLQWFADNGEDLGG